MAVEELAERAREGDAEAFVEAVEGQMAGLYKVARSILDSDEDVADAIQETILAAFEGIGRLREPGYFTTWLVRILVNKCRDRLREKSRIIPMEELPERKSRQEEYENVEWKEALSGLDEKYRLILVLYYAEGFKTAEIGQILEVPDATVRTRLSRARKQLFNLYQDDRKEKKTI